MPAEQFVSELNDQIGREYGAHQQYVAVAVYYDGLTLPQLAAFFYRQAIEERGHAMMMVQYLLDADAEVVIPGVAAPQVAFSDVVAPVSLALAQERRVTEQINELAATARRRAAARSTDWTCVVSRGRVVALGEACCVWRDGTRTPPLDH
jgi:ferritin